MKRFLIVALALGGCARADAPAPTPADAPPAGPFSVILYIGDGAGVAHWTAARLGASDLAIDRMPVVGLVDTRSSDSWITDSAAGATAFASGVRTFNGALGLDRDSAAVKTVLELAEERGMATGLVATATLTHATPAAFASHVPSRAMHWEIAQQIAERDIEVLLGGGRRYFDPAERPDSADLIGRLSEKAVFVQRAEEFQALGMDTVRALVGLFVENNPGPAIARSPSLPEMTESALRALEKSRRGFFLMVEGSQIDWRGHENAPVRELAAEVLDFDLAIRAGLHFQARRPNTLIVVVADHETGGLALHGDAAGTFRAHYTTEGHTAALVPLFAAGPGATAFGGVQENARIGQLLLRMVGAGGPSAGDGGAAVTTAVEADAWSPSSP